MSFPTIQRAEVNQEMGKKCPVCCYSFLEKVTYGEHFAFTCNCCAELGYNSCYSCPNKQQCNFHLHQACYDAALSKAHPFFGNAEFVFDKATWDNQGSNSCVACGSRVQGWKYVLIMSMDNKSRHIYLHPCCMILPVKDLHMKLEKFNCVYCLKQNRSSESVQGWAYIRDGFGVHVMCMKEISYNEWKNLYNIPAGLPTPPPPPPPTPPPHYYGSTRSNQDHTPKKRHFNFGRPHLVGGAPPGNMRKRDYIFYYADIVLRSLNFCSTSGLVDFDTIKEEILNFASSIWG